MRQSDLHGDMQNQAEDDLVTRAGMADMRGNSVPKVAKFLVG